MITIITATYNADKDLLRLIKSLRDQTSSEFQWVIADGGSTDETLRIIKDNYDLVAKLIEGPDFGIYDALNKAVKLVATKYYVVIGADDIFLPDAIHNYNDIAEKSDADFISAIVRTSDGGRLFPKRGNPFRYGHLAYVSQHSIGTLIKTSLHKTVGPYSSRFPIAADRHFIRKAIEQHNCVVKDVDFEVGIYSCLGVSNAQYYDALLDIFKVDYAISKFPRLTAIISWLRYALNIRHM